MLFIAVELVPDAMVVAMERCVGAGLHNVFFVDANADQLPQFFAPGEVDRIYINFCDPWPSKRHAKRRLTHGNFLKLYRQVLKMGGQIHFKTDNQPLFEFSVEELPRFGFQLSEVTRNLHEHGPVGVMTDYEAKFHEQGQPINRCVAPWFSGRNLRSRKTPPLIPQKGRRQRFLRNPLKNKAEGTPGTLCPGVPFLSAFCVKKPLRFPEEVFVPCN